MYSLLAVTASRFENVAVGVRDSREWDSRSVFTLFEDSSPESCDFLYRIIVIQGMVEVEADVPGAASCVRFVLEEADGSIASRKSNKHNRVRTVAFLEAIGVAIESRGDIEVANGKDEQDPRRQAN